MQAQKYCAFCGKRTKNTGGWYYAPIFCSINCEKSYRERHQNLMRTNKQYAEENKKYSIITFIYLFAVLVIPMMVLMYLLIGR